MNERLMAAEALAARLNEERAELGAANALQQQVTSIGDETAALSGKAKSSPCSSKALRGEKLRLEIRQRELEQEWDAARTRVTQMEDHLRMGASRCRNFANSAATRKSIGPRMIPTVSICARRA